jgi:hypothetical protein
MKVAGWPSQYGWIDNLLDTLLPSVLPTPPIAPHKMNVISEVSESPLSTRAAIGEDDCRFEFLPTGGCSEYHSERLLVSLIGRDDGRVVATLLSEESERGEMTLHEISSELMTKSAPLCKTDW